MDYWPRLPPVRQLPFRFRLWAWWLRNGVRRAGGVLGGSALYRMMRRLPIRRPYVVVRQPDRPHLVIDVRDPESFHHAMPVWYRGDEIEVFLRSVMRAGDTFLDIGANYGTYALRVAQAEHVRVIAVEPQPHVAEALRSSRVANAFANLEIIEAALDEEIGPVILSLGSGSGSASIVHKHHSPDALTVRLEARTLDDIAHSCGIEALRCVKIDVEGAELRVLRGGVETLARHLPLLVCEIASPEALRDIMTFLREVGYRDFWDYRSVSAGRPIDALTSPTTMNIIAATERDRDLVRSVFMTASES